MKIKCRDCGYRFRPELYSGLCPRCGAYNRYQDDVGKALKAAGERQGQWAADPVSAGQAAGTMKRPFPVLLAVLAFLAVLLPAVAAAAYQVWVGRFYETALDRDIVQVEASEGKLTFHGPYKHYPLSFTLQEAGLVDTKDLTLPEGMGLLAVRVKAYCENYEPEVSWQDPCLKYEIDGRICYREAVNYYSFPEGFFEEDFTNEDFLNSYFWGPGEEEGYLMFFYEKGAQDMELMWTLHRVQAPEYADFAIAQGSLPLGDILQKEKGAGQ